MPKFNKVLWELGRQTEDELKPDIDKFFGCDFYRNDDKFDVLDFHDDNNKVIVEVKGRKCSSTAWKETILTVGKITEGLMEVEKGYDVKKQIAVYIAFINKFQNTKLYKSTEADKEYYISCILALYKLEILDPDDPTDPIYIAPLRKKKKRV